MNNPFSLPVLLTIFLSFALALSAQENLLLEMHVESPPDTSTFRLYLAGQRVTVPGLICEEKIQGGCEYSLVVLQEGDCYAARRQSCRKQLPEPEILACLDNWDDKVLDLRVETCYHQVSLQLPIEEEKYIFIQSTMQEFFCTQFDRPVPFD